MHGRWISIAVPIADGEGRPLIVLHAGRARLREGTFKVRFLQFREPTHRQERYSHIELMRIDNLAKLNPGFKDHCQSDNPITVPHASILAPVSRKNCIWSHFPTGGCLW
jgi:hypothetical protein